MLHPRSATSPLRLDQNPTGAGKTHIACAFAQAAIRQGHTSLYLREPRMLGVALARADGRLRRLMAA